MDRRTFLRGAALGGAAAVVGAPAARAGLTNLALPSLGVDAPRPRTPVEHIVVLMLENRSVDHYLGWYGAENPAFDAIQQASFPDLRLESADPPMVPTANWGAHGLGNYHGRGHPDPSHGWTGGRYERRGGTCDGWLDPRTGNDEFALSYYDADDIPIWAQVTRGWQTYDHWFCSVLGPTQPNRFYQHSAQSAGRINNSLPPEVAREQPEYALGWDWPTIWTLLENGGVSAAYYFCNLPEILFWGHRHIRHARHISDFYAAAATGTLPQVSFIDPWYIGPEGLANDDHPHADIRLGQAFLSDVVESFLASPNYQSSALVLTYDEWGGFWDHVDPPRVADDRATPADPGGLNDFGQTGFRIPSTIVSPWTSGHGVDHTVYEHTSSLRFIADNWGLPYLNARHAGTNSLGHAFGGFASFEPEAAIEPYEAPAELVLEPTIEDLGNGELPTLPVPLSAPSPDAVSDLHRLAELGWFDKLGVRTDWRFEDSYARNRSAVSRLLQRQRSVQPSS